MLEGGLDQDSSEFANYHAYASRVIHLKYRDIEDLAQVDHSTCIRLLQSRIPFLPKLKSFTTFHHNAPAANNDKILLLLPSLLRSPFLSSVAHHMPTNLTWELGQFISVLLGLEVDIRTVRLSGALPATFVSAFASLQGLKVISLVLTPESWTPELFRALLTLELVEMKLDMGGAEVLFLEQGQIAAAAIPRFPTIKKLSLSGSIQAMYRVLKIMTPQDDLRVLSLRRAPNSGMAEPNINCLYDAIAWFPAIHTLTIDYSNSKGDDPHPSHTSLGNGRLRSLTRLESLSLKSLPSSVCFSDLDILSIAHTWPFLKVLHLEHATPASSARPMFATICQLIDECPQLVSLAITFDFGDFGHDTKVFSLCLRHLDLQDTVIARPLIVAKHLDRLCPNLLTFNVNSQDPGLWKQMCEIIFDAFRSVREDQQKRDYGSSCGYRLLSKNEETS